MCQANLETATWVISAVVAMPPSMRRGGLLAWTTAPSQVRQAYFGKIVEIKRELGDVDDGGLLRSCPEEEILQGPHDRPQALVFRIERQHHRNQTSRVGGHILRADRHT